MRIEFREITVRDLSSGYQDNQEGGVVGYNGLLDIRPSYQREFIYKDKQRDAVIHTIKRDFPLNVMYWAVRDDGTFEVIDGQQRTISICQYIEGDFSFENRYFHNLQSDEKEQILSYKLMIYLCSGTDSEKLDWFKTINIAGEKLNNQELRNAVYTGPFIMDAKRYFSRNNCPAYGIASDYLAGSFIRQDYLETAIDWISKGDIENYMATHQHDPNATELWLYFKSVIDWTKIVFPRYRKEMKGIEWGPLYDEFKDKILDSARLENEITRLMQDRDVTNHRGIYYYVLTREEKHLNIRAFDDQQKRAAYERQSGICPKCNETFEINEMHGDHITPWRLGGKTIDENCQVLCADCNRRKSGI